MISTNVHLETVDGKTERLNPSAIVVAPRPDAGVKDAFLSINIHYPGGFVNLFLTNMDDGLQFVDQLRDAVYQEIEKHRAKVNGATATVPAVPERSAEQVLSC